MGSGVGPKVICDKENIALMASLVAVAFLLDAPDV